MTEPQNPSLLPDPAGAEDRAWMTPRSNAPADSNDRLMWILGVGVPLVMLIAAAIFFIFLFNKDKAVKAIAAAEKPAASAPADPQDVKDLEIAQLRADIAAMQAHAAYPGAIAQPVYTDQNALAQVQARLDRIEANQRRLALAAAQANAAANLEVAADKSLPFARELLIVERTLDNPKLLDPIRPLAEHGVASEAMLAVEFPKIAADAAIAAKSQPERKDLLSRLAQVFAGLVSIRRVSDDGSQTPESLLVRAQSKLEQGDLEAAVTTLGSLPPQAQAAIKPWLDRARARLLVTQTTKAVTENALGHLALSQDISSPANGVGGGR